MLNQDLNLHKFSGKTDEELVEIAKCDSNAVDALILRFSKLIFIKAEIFSSHTVDSDDLRQEGVIGLMNAISSFDGERAVKFSTYAEVCIGNRMRTYAKKCNLKSQNVVSLDELPIETSSDEQDPESTYINKELIFELWRIIDTQLSALERQVFNLYVQGESYRTIGEYLTISEKTVSNALQRAKAKIRNNLNK